VGRREPSGEFAVELIGHLHLDAGGTHARDALAGHQRVGVAQGDDHAAQARRNQGVAARWGAAVVGAGLQRHPGGGAAQVHPGGLAGPQRDDLGMRPAGLLGVALPSGPIAAGKVAVRWRDDAPHPRVRVRQANGLCGQGEGAREHVGSYSTSRQPRMRTSVVGAPNPCWA
jgi:hypothetical protein